VLSASRRRGASPSAAPTSATEIFSRPHACRSYTIGRPPVLPMRPARSTPPFLCLHADGCAVLLARRHKSAMVLTSGPWDFSIYGEPFVSPKGGFQG